MAREGVRAGVPPAAQHAAEAVVRVRQPPQQALDLRRLRVRQLPCTSGTPHTDPSALSKHFMQSRTIKADSLPRYTVTCCAVRRDNHPHHTVAIASAWHCLCHLLCPSTGLAA